MTIRRRLPSIIIAILLTGVLTFGTFFSVLIETSFAEEPAGGQQSSEQTAEDNKASDPSDEGGDKGNGSVPETTPAADPVPDGNTNDTNNSADDKKILPSEPKDGEADSDGKQEGSGDTKKSTAGNEGTKEGEPEPGDPDGSGSSDEPEGDVPENPWEILPSLKSVVDHNFSTTYDVTVDENGKVTVMDVFHVFDKGATGFEELTFKVTWKGFLFYYYAYYPVTIYSDGTIEGYLPYGARIEGKNLVFDYAIGNMEIEIYDHTLMSWIDNGDSIYEPPRLPGRTTSNVRNKNTANREQPVITAGTKPVDAQAAPAVKPLDENATEPANVTSDSLSKTPLDSDPKDATALFGSILDPGSPLGAAAAVAAALATIVLGALALTFMPIIKP